MASVQPFDKLALNIGGFLCFRNLIASILLVSSFNANAEREDNCNIIGDLAFITMVERQGGVSKDDVNKNIPFEELTQNEKEIAHRLIETIYKVPLKNELNSYESLEQFSKLEKERCLKLVQEKI